MVADTKRETLLYTACVCLCTVDTSANRGRTCPRSLSFYCTFRYRVENREEGEGFLAQRGGVFKRQAAKYRELIWNGGRGGSR